MAKTSVLIRNVKKETLEQLKARAERNGRSLQAELLDILEDAAAFSQVVRDRLALLAEVRRTHPIQAGDISSVDLIREDRDNR